MNELYVHKKKPNRSVIWKKKKHRSNAFSNQILNIFQVLPDGVAFGAATLIVRLDRTVYSVLPTQTRVCLKQKTALIHTAKKCKVQWHSISFACNKTQTCTYFPILFFSVFLKRKKAQPHLKLCPTLKCKIIPKCLVGHEKWWRKKNTTQNYANFHLENGIHFVCI